MNIPKLHQNNWALVLQSLMSKQNSRISFCDAFESSTSKVDWSAKVAYPLYHTAHSKCLVIRSGVTKILTDIADVNFLMRHFCVIRGKTVDPRNLTSKLVRPFSRFSRCHEINTSTFSWFYVACGETRRRFVNNENASLFYR